MCDIAVAIGPEASGSSGVFVSVSPPDFGLLGYSSSEECVS